MALSTRRSWLRVMAVLLIAAMGIPTMTAKRPHECDDQALRGNEHRYTCSNDEWLPTIPSDYHNIFISDGLPVDLFRDISGNKSLDFSQNKSLNVLGFERMEFKNNLSIILPPNLSYFKLDNVILWGDFNLSFDSEKNNLTLALYNNRFKIPPTFLRATLPPGMTIDDKGYGNSIEDSGSLNADEERNLTIHVPGFSNTSDNSSPSPSSSSLPVGVPSQSTPPANAGSSPTSKSSATGIVVGILVAVVIVAFLAFVFVKRRRSPGKHVSEVFAEGSTPYHSHSDATEEAKSSSNIDTLEDIQLPQHEVTLTKSAGVGGLWIGEYQGKKVLINRVEAEVADAHAAPQLKQQVQVLHANRHPGIVELIGVTMLAGTDFSAVAEYMDKGTLKSVLMDADTHFSLYDRMSMCLSVARAMEFLHSNGLFVRHFSSRKVLVNSNHDCKINLFECFPQQHRFSSVESFGTGDVAWTAPEVLDRKSKRIDLAKCNAFALGVLLCELLTCASPYQEAVDSLGNTRADITIVQRIKRGDKLMPHDGRPEFITAPELLRVTIEACLSLNPSDRPTAKGVVMRLEQVLQQLLQRTSQLV
ncbi:TPA: hypothetical protein N0F65_012122 [Lagenidium giganteum]|uniref:Protein kinase domain-containing protein n=1 Tax=Lagenidium giganteum TaxID=4803 RepID=A0AAV2YNV4_9STRA|nr:TPA: hypothetical protein N0F65_012122 [Lagenidium giganteum]